MEIAQYIPIIKGLHKINIKIVFINDLRLSIFYLEQKSVVAPSFGISRKHASLIFIGSANSSMLVTANCMSI